MFEYIERAYNEGMLNKRYKTKTSPTCKFGVPSGSYTFELEYAYVTYPTKDSGAPLPCKMDFEE